MNVLITGCGGDIGQSIAKIFKDQGDKVVGTDMNNDHPAKFIFDEVHMLPPCSDSAYLDEMEKLASQLNIDIIIPSSEPELKFLKQADKMGYIGKAKVIMPTPYPMEIGFDKLATANFLKDHDLPYPETTVMGTTETILYPSILKSREGSGSKSVYVVEDEFDYEYLKRKHPEYILQEFIDGTSGEFTCCVFKHGQEIRTIIIDRVLKGEFTVFGTIRDNKAIEELLIDLANKLDLNGSINVQLRLKDGVPYVFEINPRFSSTVYFRHLLGFKDVLWSVQGALNQSIEEYTPPGIGSKIYKGYEEFIEIKK